MTSKRKLVTLRAVDPSDDNSKAGDVSDLTLGDMAYQRIKSAIIRCDLVPGTIYAENDFLERFKTSKAPTRSALLRLCHEDFVEAVARKGYLVRPITYKDILEIYELRQIVEPKIARLAAGPISKSDISDIKKTLEATYDPNDPDSKIEFLEASRAFYMHLAHATGNSRLISLASHLIDQMTRSLFLFMHAVHIENQSREEHTELLATLLEGDGEKAEQLAMLQIKKRRRMFIDRILADSDDLTSPPEKL